MSCFAYGSTLSGSQPYITVNCTMLYNGSNTKLTLQTCGNATGGNYGSKIILNVGYAGVGSISLTNDSTTTCTMTTSGAGIGKTNPNCRLYISSNAGICQEIM